MQKYIWFTYGMLIGLTVLSITKASSVIPQLESITDDTVQYQQLSEIRVKKEDKLSFDSDIAQLAKIEVQYQEALPTLSNSRVSHVKQKAAAKHVKVVAHRR